MNQQFVFVAKNELYICVFMPSAHLCDHFNDLHGPIYTISGGRRH